MRTSNSEVKTYSLWEERMNIGSHAVGFIMSSLGLIFLVLQAFQKTDVVYLFSFLVFGLSMMVLYAASTAYHASSDPKKRAYLRIVDHAAIYIFIAGSYTPFTLITLDGTSGWILFAVVWAMAIGGVILKLFFTGRFSILSTSIYLFMGWMSLIVIKPLTESLSIEGVQWLAAGGLAYTIGAILYAIKKIRFNHALFHLFVLVGSFCHFVTIYFYL